MNAQTEMTLLPCPFCGEDNKRHASDCFFVLHKRFEAEVRHLDFSSTVPVLEAWNRRAHLTKPDAGGGEVCSYPDCNCPFDAPADPNWCARGFKKAAPPSAVPAEPRNACLYDPDDVAFPKDFMPVDSNQDHSEHVLDMVAEPSVVPMPEPALLSGYNAYMEQRFFHSSGMADALGYKHSQKIYFSADQLTAYADARVSEATRELVDGLRELASVAERCDGWESFPIKPLDAANSLIAKYTQTQKESKNG